jgi:hypothetical protein
MNKKSLMTLVIVTIVISFCIFSAIGIYLLVVKNESSSDNGLELETEVTVESIGTFTQPQEGKALGTVEITNLGQSNTIEIEARTEELNKHYIRMEIDGEALHMYVDDTTEVMYAYLANNEEDPDVVRFIAEDVQNDTSLYTEMNDTNPFEILEGLETLESEENITITHNGTESCLDLVCEKYTIVDSTAGQEGTLIIWIDTKQNLIRMFSMDSIDMKANFNLFYEPVDIVFPAQWEDISVDSIVGLQKMYKVAGDFVEVFI